MTTSACGGPGFRLSSVVWLSLAVACGGGGSGGGEPRLQVLAAVAPAFPGNGAGWNDYVAGGSTGTASDVACDAATDVACVHGGEARVVTVTGATACAGLSASDALGAFDWSCDASTGTARMVSVGLRRGRYLSDLIDFAALQWKSNGVTVSRDGSAFAATPSTRWWSNPIVATDGTSSSLASAGTVYVVRADVTGTFTLDASKVALVNEPGTTITGSAGSMVRVVSADSRDFVWIEASVDALDSDICFSWNFVRFSTMRNVVAKNASTVNKRGLLIYGATHSRFTDILAANNGETGLWFNACSNDRLTNLRSSGNGLYGMELYDCTDNVLEGVVVASNGSLGIYGATSSNNVLSHVFAGNTGAAAAGIGIQLASSNDDLLASVAAMNNGGGGIGVVSSSNDTFSDIASDNDGYELYLSGSSHGRFTGLLELRGGCYVSGGTSPGLVTGTCSETGAAGSSTYGADNTSDAVLTPGITLAAAPIGPVTADDPSNGSDTSGASASYPVDPAAFDWSGFENPFRSWGKDGAPDSLDSRGRWTTGAGRIWDWSLRGTDTVLRGVLPVPTGDDTLTHTWSDATSVTFLKSAVELIGDGDGLCESGETCLYTPNIGAYQGHGGLVSAGTFTDGALTGVTLLRYESNGY